VSRKLVQEGHLYPAYAPALLRMQLDGPLQPLWSEGYVRLSDVWEAFTKYIYLPRVTRREVLETAVKAGPAATTWQMEGFATADAWSEEDGRFIGLTVGQHPVAVGPATLLVRPEVALQYLGLPDPGESDSAEPEGPDDVPDAELRRRRFYGAVQLDSERPSREFGRIVQEILQHLTAEEGTELKIVVEIDARNDEGFQDKTVRVVDENARALRFKTQEFER